MGYISIFRPDLFQDRSILITGGGSGIGRCAAHELSALGAHISIVGRTEDKLKQVQQEIVEDGGGCDIYSADIRDEERIKELVGEVLSARGRIDGLFNNAGGQFSAPIAKMSKKGFSAVIESNLIGGFVTAREVFNQSMGDTGGSIVNMSGNVYNGVPNFSHTAAAREAMTNFTKTAAVEWAYAGVRVNAVSPGFVESSGADTYNSGTEAENKWKEAIKKMNSYVPMRRKGLEAEVSSAVCYLLSEGAAYVTGANIKVDGGLGLGVPWYMPPELEREVAYSGFHRAVKPNILSER